MSSYDLKGEEEYEKWWFLKQLGRCCPCGEDVEGGVRSIVCERQEHR